VERESPALLRMAEDGVCSRGLHLLVEDQCPLCSLFLGKLAIKIRVRHETHPGYFHLVSFIRMTC
jgi:hypothetical protein